MISPALHFILLWFSSVGLLSIDGVSQPYIILGFFVLLIINVKVNLTSYLTWLLLSYGFHGYLSTTTYYILKKTGIVDVTGWYTFMCLLVFSVNALLAYDRTGKSLGRKATPILLSLLVSTFFFNSFSSKYGQYNGIISFTNNALLSFIFLFIAFSYWQLKPYNYSQQNKLMPVIFVLAALVINAPQFVTHKKKIGILHSEWCQTGIPYTFKDFTMKSNYSYSIMKDLLNRKHAAEVFYEVSEAIYEYDVLVLMTPTKPFSTSACNTILNFVKSGNRLVVIAEHTDLYGHAKVLNDLLDKIGVEVSYDSLFNSADYHANLSIQHGLFGRLRALTPCSFNSVFPSFVWAKANNWISEKAEYTKPNFFGDLTWTSDDKVGDYFVGATFAYGFGQVSIWTDSTIFANFFVFQPKVIDALEMLIEEGAVAALLGYVFCAFYLGLIVTGVFKVDHAKASGLVIVMLIFVSGIAHVIWTNPLSFYPKDGVLRVLGEKRHITEAHPRRTPSSESLSTFYSDIGRGGIYPYYAGNSFSSCDGCPCLFIGEAKKFMSIGKHKNLKAIIVDNDEVFIEKTGIEATSYDDELDNNIFHFVEFTHNPNIFYAKHSGIDNEYQGIPFLCSSGIVSDQQLGSWWRNYPISPFKRYYTLAVANWITDGKSIEPFGYPPAEIHACEDRYWELGAESSQKTRVRFCVNNGRSYSNFVYLGAGLWARINRKGNRLLGGPETTDNLLVNAKKWAAKSLKTDQ